MNANEFLAETMYSDEPSFTLLKSMLMNKYIEFSFHEFDEIDASILSEKLSDYFSMVSMKTFKTFDELVTSFMDGLDSIVGPRIERATSAGIPRARKYYDRFIGIKSSKDVTIEDLVDYSRIMLCLYQSIVENNLNPIRDFDYSILSLDVVQIIESMLSEESRGLFSPFGSKRFDIKEKHETGSCIIVMTMIMLTLIAVVELDEDDEDE